MKPSYYASRAEQARNYKWVLILLAIGAGVAVIFITGIGQLACACFCFASGFGAFIEAEEAARLAHRAKEESDFQSVEHNQRNVAQ